MTTGSLSAAPTFALTRFELEVDPGSSRLYANGRQQVKVLITLSAIKPADFKEYVLTEKDLETLELIEYNADNVVLSVIEGETITSGWGYTKVQNKFTTYPSALNDVSESPERLGGGVLANQFETFYVQTAANSQLKIGARIWGGEKDEDDNKVYISTNAASTIKDSVTLIPERVPLYSRENLVFTAAQIEGDSSSPFGWDSVDYYSFSLRPQSGAGNFLEIIGNPKGMSMFDAAPLDRGSCVGWANIGEKKVTYSKDAEVGHPTLVTGYPEVGKGTLVLVRRNKMTLPNPQGRPDAITIRDEYGNDYAIPFNFGATRSTLIFT